MVRIEVGSTQLLCFSVKLGLSEKTIKFLVEPMTGSSLPDLVSVIQTAAR